MNVGVVGLGRLGLVLARALAAQGHGVCGYDIDPDAVFKRIKDPVEDMPEAPIAIVDDLQTMVDFADLVFVAVQTPHPPEFSGAEPNQHLDPVNFTYDHLIAAVGDLAKATKDRNKGTLIVGVVCTVAPGTMREVVSAVPDADQLRLVYCPSFISLGNIYHDLRYPRMLLTGSRCEETGDFAPSTAVFMALRSLKDPDFTSCAGAVSWPPRRPPNYPAPVVTVDFDTAELIKLAYNVLQTLKITFVNHLAELADRFRINIDDVTDALQRSNEIEWIPTAGMADGGACRPRDLVALSWLEQSTGTSTDFFATLAMFREDQMNGFARKTLGVARNNGLGIVVLGKTYKPGVPYEDGSPGHLLYHYLDKFSNLASLDHWDPIVDGVREFRQPKVFFVATPHPEFQNMTFPSGSIVIDPWGLVEMRQPNVTYIYPGRGGNRGRL